MKVFSRFWVLSLVMSAVLFAGCVEEKIRFTLINSTMEPPGANCALGGVKFESGIDVDGSGELEEAEIQNTSYACNTRVDGHTSLITIDDEAPGANCEWGGQKIQTGLDLDDDNFLDAVEIESTAYTCKGEPGTNGTDGVTSLIRLTRVDPSPTGTCIYGGTRIDTGLDDNNDTILQPGEIDQTQYVCSVDVNPNLTLVSNSVENPGPNCANGGVRTLVGYDDDNDHILDAAEIDSTTFVCNVVILVAGKSSITITSPATAQQCPWGGIVLQTGQDDNYNNQLGASEVDSTSLICNGANGFTSLVKQTSYSGALCGTEGGVKFESGLDTNHDEILQVGEVQATSYICNGIDGFLGYDGLNSLIEMSDAGSACFFGGVRLESGLDDDGDGFLDFNEVEQTSFVCNGADGYSGLVDISDDGGACGIYGGNLIESGLDLDYDGFLDSGEVDTEAYVCHGVDGYDTLVDTTENSSFCGGGLLIEVGLDFDRDGILDFSEIESEVCL